MALHAVLIVADALFKMLFPDFGAGVLVATITGVCVIAVVDMACDALRVVVSIKAKVVVVLEASWRPALLRMTGAAVEIALRMQGIVWISVATFALILYRLLQQSVRKPANRTERLNPFVVTVTSHAILFDQILVERYTLLLLDYGR